MVSESVPSGGAAELIQSLLSDELCCLIIIN